MVTPEFIIELGRLYLAGHTKRQCADILGVNYNTVDRHLEQTVQPLWREYVNRGVEYEIAKIDALEQVAWERYRASKEPRNEEQIKRAVQEDGVDLAVVEKVMKRIQWDGTPAWLQVVEWCIEYRCKLLGYEKGSGADENIGSPRRC